MIDYFLSNLWQMWALVCILCLIMELFSGDFFIMCFSIAAFATAFISPFTTLTVQLIIFALISVLCLLFVRPVALKYLHKSKDERMSNVDAIIGRTGRVSETIVKDAHGRVAIDGDDWKALSVDGEEIEKGTRVEVVSIDSIIITVRRK
ncbi:MAG: NfeD family protein [Muribaculaceae bacterium]|nr:NfeD family protein [Muribaculaceae bacterium]